MRRRPPGSAWRSRVGARPRKWQRCRAWRACLRAALAASSRRAGLPPDEDPATSVARELLVETGYTVKDVRPAGVGPLQIDWPAMEEALLSEKQRERCQQFQGVQSHFFSGAVAGPPVQAVDPSGLKDVRFRRPWSLQ